MLNLKTFMGATAIAVVTSTGAFAQGAKVTIGDPAWAGATAIGQVIKAIIEGPLQGEAEITSGLGEAGAIFAGMDKGDGTVDVHPDVWRQLNPAIWEKYVVDAKTVGVSAPYIGTEAIFVPHYMSDKVSSYDDLKNPAIAALFDKDGNGKGEYWAGDASWSSSQVLQIKFKSLGLDELWEAEILPDATFKAQLEATYNKGTPILFYYWTPEWIHSFYDLVALEEKPFSPDCTDLNLDQDDWLEASTVTCANEPTSIYVGYSRSLEQRNPAVAKMLSNMNLDSKTVGSWILQIDRDGLDARDVAEEWVKDNMDLVNSWING